MSSNELELTEEKKIGTIYAVTGTKTIAILDDSLKTLTMNFDGKIYYIGQIGTYVIMTHGITKIIGIISQIKMTEIPFRVESDKEELILPKDKKIIEIQLIGTLKDNEFQRGISIFPNIQGPVYMTTEADFKKIFSKYQAYEFPIGKITILEDQDVYIDPNSFFNKHIAILGSTGSGKSCSVASILQKINERVDHPHIILLDYHNEYAAAFPDDANVYHIPEFQIPFWLLNFQELADIFIDVKEFTAHNQITVLKNTVIKSKIKHNKGIAEINLDTPVYFSIEELIKEFKELDTQMVRGSGTKDKQGPYHGKLTRMIMRMESKIDDKRYDFIFKPSRFVESKTLISLLKQIFSVEPANKISIIDLSGIPYDVRNVVVSLLARTIFDFNFWNPIRSEFPILVVFEEAHAYLPQTDVASFRSAKSAVERIVKEGRKYGVAAMIISQRPSEVSSTILAQCNNFINFRVTNPVDQNYIKSIVPDSLSSIVEMLPSLRQGEGIMVGDAIVLPTRILFDLPAPEPKSSDIPFYDKWKSPKKTINIEKVVDNWWKQIKE